jgi:ABC-type transport system involved in multi-copper enzyme maturation permease subunit
MLSVLWALVILGLCAMPGQYIPEVNWLEYLSFDKWVHAAIFFILCGLIFLSGIKHNKSFIYSLFFFCLAIIYGGVLELLQARLFSQRGADWADFAANSFGCLLALAFYQKLKREFVQSVPAND